MEPPLGLVLPETPPGEQLSPGLPGSGSPGRAEPLGWAAPSLAHPTLTRRPQVGHFLCTRSPPPEPGGSSAQVLILAKRVLLSDAGAPSPGAKGASTPHGGEQPRGTLLPKCLWSRPSADQDQVTLAHIKDRNL